MGEEGRSQPMKDMLSGAEGEEKWGVGAKCGATGRKPATKE